MPGHGTEIWQTQYSIWEDEDGTYLDIDQTVTVESEGKEDDVYENSVCLDASDIKVLKWVITDYEETKNEAS